MKKLFVLAALAAMFTIPTMAQSKNDLFSKIAKLSQDKAPEKKAEAFKLAQDYLAKFGKDTDPNTKKIADFVSEYRLSEFNKALDEGRYDDAFDLGKQLLVVNPEDSYVTMNLAYAGYDALAKKKDSGYADASINYAQQTLALFEAGKLPKTFVPFKDQQDATALMYFAMANLQLGFDEYQAALNLYKAFKYESQIKTNAYCYYLIANYYEKAYKELADDFKLKHGTKRTEDAAMKADTKKLEEVLGLMIDAYARAAKFSEEGSPNKAAWNDRLTALYKFLKGSDKGLTELIANISTTPMPEPKSF